jgi:hypothetical protein|tara:strand:- start:514 stop:1581 length:1068 start_codon:yes stop_codon:yes gene_type:complete
MSILKYLKQNKNFINLIFFRGFGSGLGMLIYILVLGFFGNYFALAHSGFITSYQVGQAGCTFERNLISKSAEKKFFQNLYLRFFFSSLWLLILYFIFEIDLYYICFLGFFISFIYLVHFDKHTKFIQKSSLILSFVPVLTIIIVSLFFYLFPYNLGFFDNINYEYSKVISFLICTTAILIAFFINKNSRFFIFEILYCSIPIFILSFILKNQINEKITFYIIIFYKILEFLYAGCYFALTGTKNIKKIIDSFLLTKKYYTIFLIILIPLIFIFIKSDQVSIILVFWIFLFRISSFLLLGNRILISSIYIIYSILLIYFSAYLSSFIFVFLLILPNVIILLYQKKMNFTNFVNLKT